MIGPSFEIFSEELLHGRAVEFLRLRFQPAAQAAACEAIKNNEFNQSCDAELHGGGCS